MAVAIAVISAVLGLIIFVLAGVWTFFAYKLFQTSRKIQEAEKRLAATIKWEKEASAIGSLKKASKSSKSSKSSKKSKKEAKSKSEISSSKKVLSKKSESKKRSDGSKSESKKSIVKESSSKKSFSNRSESKKKHSKKEKSSKTTSKSVLSVKDTVSIGASPKTPKTMDFLAALGEHIQKQLQEENKTIVEIKGDRRRTQRADDNFAELAGKAAEFINDYMQLSKTQPVSSDLLPGFLVQNLPTHAPSTPEDIQSVLNDLKINIVPKMTHWQHPHFLGSPTPARSIPDAVAELILSHMGSPGFIYDASPTVAEMDVAMLNWAGRAIGLPEQFLFHANSETSTGGGSLQESVGDSTLCTLMAARWTVTNRILIDQGKIGPDECYLFSEKTKDDMELHHKEYEKLCVYASAEAHPTVAKQCRLAMLRHKPIEALAQNGYGITAEQVQARIQKDMANGMVPCCIIVTLGTRGIMASDQLEEIGRLAQHYGCWLHVDASNVSPFWMEPKYRPNPTALLYASSVLCMLPFHSTNMIAVWTRHQKSWKSGFKVAAQYLKPTKSFALDVRDWTIHLNRRFRSLKMWFNYRLLGLKQMRQKLETLVSLAERLERKLSSHDHIRIFGTRVLNTFCFQYYENGMKMSDVNKYTRMLGLYLNESGRVFVKILEITGWVVLSASVSVDGTTEAIMDGLYGEMDKLIREFSTKKSDGTLLRHESSVSLLQLDSSSLVSTARTK